MPYSKLQRKIQKIALGEISAALEAVFTCAHFSLTTTVSHGTLYLVLGFVGIHFAAASRCALTKFSYSSFRVPFPSSLKQLEKKLDRNYTRMQRAILNKSWQQHPTRHQLYSHLPPITKPIQVRRTKHAEHCWKSRDELISDVLLWTPTYGRAKAGRPARTYIQ